MGHKNRSSSCKILQWPCLCCVCENFFVPYLSPTWTQIPPCSSCTFERQYSVSANVFSLTTPFLPVISSHYWRVALAFFLNAPHVLYPLQPKCMVPFQTHYIRPTSAPSSVTFIDRTASQQLAFYRCLEEMEVEKHNTTCPKYETILVSEQCTVYLSNRLCVYLFSFSVSFSGLVMHFTNQGSLHKDVNAKMLQQHTIFSCSMVSKRLFWNFVNFRCKE